MRALGDFDGAEALLRRTLETAEATRGRMYVANIHSLRYVA